MWIEDKVEIKFLSLSLHLNTKSSHWSYPKSVWFEQPEQNCVLYVPAKRMWKSMKTWFAIEGVEELEWPSKSPDLKGPKHLWDEFE